MRMAIIRNDMRIFNILIEKGCQLSEECMGDACLLKNGYMIDQLLAHNCPLNGHDICTQLSDLFVIGQALPYKKGMFEVRFSPEEMARRLECMRILQKMIEKTMLSATRNVGESMTSLEQITKKCLDDEDEIEEDDSSAC